MAKKKLNNYLDTNENTTYQNLRDAAKAVKRGNFITNAPINKEGRKISNHLTLQLKNRQKQTKARVVIGKEIKIRANRHKNTHINQGNRM